MMAQIGRVTYEVDKAGCWICTSHARMPSGYSRVCVNGKSQLAHRYVYELCNGPIPDGYCVRHSCDVPSCINPGHLLVGTIGDNNRDMVVRRRHASFRSLPEGRRKLTDKQIENIRNNPSITGGRLAVQLGVSQQYISRIRTGQARKYSPGECHQKPRGPKVKLSEKDVVFIRDHPEVSLSDMADRFQVCTQHISDIRTGKRRNNCGGIRQKPNAVQRLTDENVRFIRSHAETRSSDLARLFGVSVVHINRIRAGTTRKQATGYEAP